MSSLGWIASVASSVFVVTTMVEAAIDISNPDFGFPNWQYSTNSLSDPLDDCGSSNSRDSSDYDRFFVHHHLLQHMGGTVSTIDRDNLTVWPSWWLSDRDDPAACDVPKELGF